MKNASIVIFFIEWSPQTHVLTFQCRPKESAWESACVFACASALSLFRTGGESKPGARARGRMVTRVCVCARVQMVFLAILRFFGSQWQRPTDRRRDATNDVDFRDAASGVKNVPLCRHPLLPTKALRRLSSGLAQPLIDPSKPLQLVDQLIRN